MQVNGTPTVPGLQLTATDRGWPPTVTLLDAEPLTVLPSLAVLLIEYVPFGEHVTEMLLVVEDPVHPVGTVQVNVYGAVPPVADAVHVNALPEVTPELGQVTVTTTG